MLPAETRLTVYRRRPFGRSRYILPHARPVLLRSGLSLVSRSGDSAPGPKETEDAERARETGTERLAQQAFAIICARVSRVILGAIPRLPLVGGHPSTMQTYFGVGTQDGRTTVQGNLLFDVISNYRTEKQRQRSRDRTLISKNVLQEAYLLPTCRLQKGCILQFRGPNA